MSRPPVTVVMPFAGDAQAAASAAGALRSLDVSSADELILVDNAGSAPSAPGGDPAIRVLTSLGEASPAHARNVGAAAGRTEWILFLDADTHPSEGLLAAYFAQPIAPEVAALAGEIHPSPPRRGLVSRYGSERSFLDQRAHLSHPYRPRVAAANLLVRRAAFEQLGGFFEGVRAAEDTDFSWRLQEEGWRIELRPEAWVSHTYRSSLGQLRRQWRGYAAGRAWLARRYDGFHPQPALVRALRGGGRRSALTEAHAAGAEGDRGHPAGAGPEPRRAGRGPARARPGRLTRTAFLALDGLLAVEELVGFTLSNRPTHAVQRRPPARVVGLAEVFPVPGDPLVELVAALEGARVQALRRPACLDRAAAARIQTDYLEDDGAAARTLAVIAIALRHPLRSLLDLAVRTPGQASLRTLAPAARRLEPERGARLLALGRRGPRTVAGRIARLAGRKLDDAS